MFLILLGKNSTVESALHGLKLVLRYEYVGLLFGISCLYEVVLTILDYQMKVGRLLLSYYEPRSSICILFVGCFVFPLKLIAWNGRGCT